VTDVSQTIKDLTATGEHATAADLARGRGMVDAATAVVRGVPAVAHHAVNAANTLLAPATAVGKPLLHGAGTVGRAIAGSPGVTKALIGASILGPILTQAATSSSRQETQKLLNSSQFPERTVLASVDQFFIKVSGAEDRAKAFGGMVFEGLGSGTGKGLSDLLFSGGASIAKALHNGTVAGPQRERTFYEAIKTDNVLRDALRSNPAVLAQLKEAFATLSRFAPSLAVDVNAVRSYLREAIVSGGGINFATIKQLADTEKVIQDRNRGTK